MNRQLQSTLAETKFDLDTALDKICELSAELQRFHPLVRNEQLEFISKSETAPEIHGKDTRAASSGNYGFPFKLQPGLNDIKMTTLTAKQRLDSTGVFSTLKYTDPLWPSAQSSEILVVERLFPSHLLTNEYDCGALPLAEQDESTIECTSAYEIIGFRSQGLGKQVSRDKAAT